MYIIYGYTFTSLSMLNFLSIQHQNPGNVMPTLDDKYATSVRDEIKQLLKT